jgi:ubiquinone/menaquinone biosynthesis C-methylase UbiE
MIKMRLQVIKLVKTPYMKGYYSMKDLYEKFAYDYDEFGPIEEYLGDEKTFLNKIFTEHGVKNVLDCACGTGQHLLMLAQSGYNINPSGSGHVDTIALMSTVDK